MTNSQPTACDSPKIVIIGAGFGGLACVDNLASVRAQITLIDRQNHHLFQPLLYEVATAGLSPADIATPIRSVVDNRQDVRVLMDEVVDVDTARQQVVTKERRIDYDYLVIATGAAYSFFGKDHWREHALCLKSLDDALEIRQRLLNSFELAEMTTDAVAQRGLMTVAIVGAGPTGVEMAGAVAELCKRALKRDFRRIDPTSARIILVEAGPRLLPSFPERLSDYAERALIRLGVEVHKGQAVEDINEHGIVAEGIQIDAGTVVWSAGVEVPAVSQWLGAPADRSGRIAVKPDLSVPNQTNIYVIGDAALVRDTTEKPLPGVAPVAKQQGKYVAETIKDRLDGKIATRAFFYRDYGNLATIGRSAAILDLGWLRLKGWLAWMLWSIAHIYFLIGTRNRLAVFLNWIWAYVTFGRGARLIIRDAWRKPVSKQHEPERREAA